MNAETRAKDYINIMLKNIGYNCMTILENSDKELEGKTVIFEDDFLKEVKKAFITGFTIAREKCGEKTCQNCEYYNGIGFIDEYDRPNISCRLGGYHMGFDACGDYKKADFESGKEEVF